MHEVFNVTILTGYRRSYNAFDLETPFSNERNYPVFRRLPCRLIPYDPALADLFFPDLELGFNEGYDPGTRV
jgi:hypothetical protein